MAFILQNLRPFSFWWKIVRSANGDGDTKRGKNVNQFDFIRIFDQCHWSDGPN